MSRKWRIALLLLSIVTVSIVTLLFLPGLFSDESCEIVLQGCDVSKEGNGIVRYHLRLSAGSTLMAGCHPGADEGATEEVKARSFPGWALKESRTLSLGNVEDL